MMDVPQEVIERVRAEGRRRRRLTRVERMRAELAGIVDTGSLSDDDVTLLYGHYRAGRDEEGER